MKDSVPKKGVSLDLTLLGVPGTREDGRSFYHETHLAYIARYGRQDYLSRKAWAQERHLKWIADGYTMTPRRNWAGDLYIDAVANEEKSCVSD